MKAIEKSFYDIIHVQAINRPDTEAVVMGDVRLTYRNFLDKIDGVASVLLNKGIKKGDKVALWSVASPAWLYCYVGIIRAGGIAVLLNANLSLKDAGPLVEFADTKHILFGKTHDFEGHSQDIDTISESFGLDKAHCMSIVDEEFICTDVIEPDTSGMSVHDDAYIIYTSGTTAFPKAVLNSQYALINVSDRLGGDLKSILGERALIGVPFFHVYALVGVWIYLANGGTVIIPKAIKADVIAGLVEKEDITDIWSVTVLYQSIMENEDLTAKVAGRARLCTVAGSYTSPVQFMRFETAFYKSTFINLYGMTET